MNEFSDERLLEVRHGTVPWDVEQCIDLMQFQKTLAETPKDDWDLTERGIGSNIRLNMFAPMNQLGMYAVRRLDERHAHHHLWRFMQIEEFIDENVDALIDHGLCRASHGEREVCRPLIEALCKLPFSHQHVTEEGEELRTFDFDEVIEEIKQRGGEAS